MKKNVWIINHYAADMFSGKMGRHYNFAKYLKEKGYNPIVFCSNIEHRSGKIIDTKNKQYIVKKDKYSKFVFIKISEYSKDIKKRVVTMLQFFFAIIKITNDFEKPDVIIGSSVHPLACVAGILLAKKYHCDCISEIRDLWPESLVAYNIIKRTSLLYNFLLKLEKWIYINSDKIIFTMPNAYQYIKDMKWQREILKNKIFYINNGIDYSKIISNKNRYNYVDNDLDNNRIVKFTYAGSIRKANDIYKLIEVASILSSNNKIKFIIFGTGTDLNLCKKNVKVMKLSNIVFKGYIENKYLQSVYSKSNFLIFHFKSTSIMKYGSSSNKLFEYISSGKPILSTIYFKNNFIDKYKLGFCAKKQIPEIISNLMIDMSKLNKIEYNKIANNCKNTIKYFDYKYLTNELINVIEG